MDGLACVAGLGAGLLVPQRQRGHRVDATGEQGRLDAPLGRRVERPAVAGFGVAVPEDRPERGDPLVGVVAAGVQRYESDPDPCYPFAAAWAFPSITTFSA